MDTVDAERTRLRGYLDMAIKNWRQTRDDDEADDQQKALASAYIDAFQSVRLSILGFALP